MEQLEATFYTQALAKFQDSDFVTAGFPSPQVAIEQLSQIQADESTHSTVLQAALKSFGEEPITSCKFNFDSVLTDVTTMAVVARVVETVGVGAYLGGSTLLTDPVLLTSAASILTVEARHQTILNVLSGSGTAIPSAFDIALTPSEVLALAGPFFDGPCDLGIPANPGLSLTNTGSVGVGTQLSFTSPAITSANDTSVSIFRPSVQRPSPNFDAQKFFCQMLVGGAFSSIALPFDNCVVPAGINGPVAIFITSDGQPLLNNVRDRATTQLVAGPLMAFIDTQPQMLGQLARQGSDSNSPSSTSTRTISPAEASSIIATDAASATPAPTGAASATDSAATASSTDAASSQVLSASAPSTPGKPNAFVGKSADGSIGVLGWSNLPSN